MKPDIFMDDFERTEYSDTIYSIVDRALTIASRFESLCKSYAALIGIKESPDVLGDEDALKKMVETVRKGILYSSIKSIVGEECDFEKQLHEARNARNEIADEVSLGLDRCIDLLPTKDSESLVRRILELVEKIAKAGCLISLAVTLKTNDHFPNSEFIKNYPKMIKDWIVDEEDKRSLNQNI